VQLIKSNVKSKNASQYKMKRDFAVVTFGQHYSVIRRRDVTDKEDEEAEEDEEASGNTSKEEDEEASSATSEEHECEEDGVMEDNAPYTGCCCGCGVDASASTQYCSNTNRQVTAGCYTILQHMEGGFSGNSGVCNGCYPKMEDSYCCCGCKYIASSSTHTCLHSGKKVLPYCFPNNLSKEESKDLKFLCSGCFKDIAPEEGTPARSALRAKSKEAMIAQGERMRKYAQARSNGNKSGPLVIGTVVRVKVDKVDRGKLDHHSVPGVIVQVTDHDNYRIACKGGVLKECLGAQRFQVEPIKKAEHYELEEAFRCWETMRKISIREALTFISKMGGQGAFHCSCKGACNKNTCKCRKNGRECNSKCHPRNTSCINTS
jgi:hypothetical protein